MKRANVARALALCVLLLQSGAFGMATVFDAVAASRANGAVVHIEADAGKGCVAHDESTCQLCRAASTAGCTPQSSVVVFCAMRGVPPRASRVEFPTVAEQSGLHSRAPPSA